MKRLRIKKIIWGLVAVFALLGVAEMGLRIAGRQIMMSRYWNEKNQPYKEGDINIVCLGESTTEGLYVDPKFSYPSQLESLLRAHYGNDKIQVRVPPHVGQNTSQQLNRIDDYLDTYKPKLLIVMSGANDEWALAESHIGDFLPLDGWLPLKVRLHVFFDQFRVFRVARMVYVRLKGGITSTTIYQGNEDVVWGHPEKLRWPPEKDLADYALSHQESFVKLWYTDLWWIVKAAHDRGIEVIVANYPSTPGYLKPEYFQTLAKESKSVFVDNSLEFAVILKSEKWKDFMFEDGFHPTAKGYEIVAQTFHDTIVERGLLGLSEKRVDEGHGASVTGSEPENRRKGENDQGKNPKQPASHLRHDSDAT